MFARLAAMQERFERLEEELGRPEVAADPRKSRKLLEERRSLESAVATWRDYQKVEGQLAEARELAAGPDAELAELARSEVERLSAEEATLTARLKKELLPKDPLDEKDIVVEIRAGTGGDEASLFVADLARMYQKYADKKGWRHELIDAAETAVGGLREVIFSIKGERVYSHLKRESGVHRVQRVPATEAQGRIHTSTVTVAILPEADEVDVHVNEADLRVDTFCSSGPGGQSVNTTKSAVRLTHVPTGLVVQCQDEKSQIKNKSKALRVLRARLLALETEKAAAERSQSRREQIGTGERAERIRTYNFPQSRVSDHRINLTLYNLPAVIEGDLDPVVEPLQNAAEEEALKALAETA